MGKRESEDMYMAKSVCPSIVFIFDWVFICNAFLLDASVFAHRDSDSRASSSVV